MYRHRGLLECQVSRPNAQVRWFKSGRELATGQKYQLLSQDVYRQLTIDDICSSDEDTYTCDAGDDKTSCQLLVEGERSPSCCGPCSLPRETQDSSVQSSPRPCIASPTSPRPCHSLTVCCTSLHLALCSLLP